MAGDRRVVTPTLYGADYSLYVRAVRLIPTDIMSQS